MDFFEKIGETVTEKGKEVADKAKETAEIIRLKSQVATCEEVMKKNYLEIGKAYYREFGDIPEEAFAKQCRAIRNAENGVKELEEQIRQLKGL